MPAAGLIAQLFLIALTNLLLFAWFECDADSKMGQASLATRFGIKNSKHFSNYSICWWNQLKFCWYDFQSHQLDFSVDVVCVDWPFYF
jgi:hypothetical protein